MRIFGKFGFGNKAPIVNSQEAEQAVIVYLNGTDLSDEVYQNHDTSSLEDQLTEALEGTGIGEVDGSETGPTETVLYLYGSDSERLFAKVEPILRSYPLCEKARVVVRQGKTGAPEREFYL